MLKPTKVPYHPSGWKASVTDANHWSILADLQNCNFNSLVPVDPDFPVSESGFSGIGFVFTEADPYAFIDLDDTHGDNEAYQRQVKVFQEFNSYSELSPSGSGVHIIIKGAIPRGRRREAIEIYSNERYATFTGNVINDVPIAEKQELLTVLWEQMGGNADSYVVAEDKEQTQTDEEIVDIAFKAVNGEKFSQLWQGDWERLYSSQSEADFALVDIIAFYTQNKAQIMRLFRQSALGQRDKAKRDRYVGYMIDKSFDRKLPPIDIDGLKVKFDNLMRERTAGEPGGTPAVLPLEAMPAATGNGGAIGGEATLPQAQANVNSFPPGLLGEIAQFFYDAAPRPVPEIALAGAIGFLAGITGRAYNVSGTGLNQYILMLAPTGVGKEAISDGASKLLNMVKQTVPSVIDFRGPGELVSAAGLIKWVAKKPCFFSILGEFGKKMKEMANPQANVHLQSINRILLQVYSKSGHNSLFDPMAYSDTSQNTEPVYSPALTIIGESVPESFYEVLDENMIADGLLPRFMVFEYKGQREYFNEHSLHVNPSFSLVQKLGDLTATCLSHQHSQNVNNVSFSPEAKKTFDEFDVWTTDQINNSKSETHRQLWNRAHLKAMKLAALQAIGINYVAPVISINECLWATNIIVAQTQKLIAKFEAGAIGQSAGSESKQIQEMIKVISSYYANNHDVHAKYGGTWEMHKQGIILESHISRRLISMSCFRLDRMGATAAIKRALKIFLDADDLREIPASQMNERFGTKARAFCVANPLRFAPKDD